MLYELMGLLQGLLGKDMLNSLGLLAVPSPPSAVSIGYAVLYLVVVFGWGARRLSRKDIM